MLFIITANEEKKFLKYNSELFIHGECGKYGKYTVFMSFMLLRIFFIPIFKWNKRYFVKTSCCDKIYSLDAEIGKKIEIGECVKIKNTDIKYIFYQNTWSCSNCGYISKEDFNYCPICGKERK